MAVVLYWKERLDDRQPFASESMRLEGYNLKSHRDGREDTWPRAIAKQAMYADYLNWFEARCLPQYKDVPYYKDFPDQLPKPANQLEFFSTIGPFLYVVGAKQQVRAYHVPEKRQHEGEWVTVRVYRNFVRLCSWEEHVAQFELMTGQHSGTIPTQAEKIGVVVEANGVAIRKIATNRETIDRAMGKS